jgi:uncharacterized membrane protein
MDIVSELLIDADIEQVWALTVDVEAWPSLTPTVTRVERLDDGPFGIGSRARIKQPGMRPAVWTVTRFERPTAFAWQTKVLTVTMTGSHHLEAVDGRCRNVLRVELAGPGQGLLRRLLGRRIQQAIDTENEGFRARAEARVG